MSLKADPVVNKVVETASRTSSSSSSYGSGVSVPTSSTSSLSSCSCSTSSTSVGYGSTSSRAVAMVTNKWYREQKRAEQEATRSLTLLKQRKISCILKAESLHRGLGRGKSHAEDEKERELEQELQDLERKMSELVKEREERCKKIMDRRVQQVNTLQELGLLEAVGRESKQRAMESDLKENTYNRDSPVLSSLCSQYSPASSASSRTSRRTTPPPQSLKPKLSTGSLGSNSGGATEPPDPASRLEAAPEIKVNGTSGKGTNGKISPRLGRRNPLRMLSNAIDFRTKRKQRPKSADFESVDETDSGKSKSASTTSAATGKTSGGNMRSASVTDILESVTVAPEVSHAATMPRSLEGRNSAPDMLPVGRYEKYLDGGVQAQRGRTSRSGTAVLAKQKLSTRFQPQRKPSHRAVVSSGHIGIKRAKTFTLGGVAHPPVQASYKTLPKQSSSRSLGSSSTDSGQSTVSSRKSSNSSNLSEAGDSCTGPASHLEISEEALMEIAAFEKFIENYFQNCDSQSKVPAKPPVRPGNSSSARRMKSKVSASSTLSEVLELSI